MIINYIGVLPEENWGIATQQCGLSWLDTTLVSHLLNVKNINQYVISFFF